MNGMKKSKTILLSILLLFTFITGLFVPPVSTTQVYASEGKPDLTVAGITTRKSVIAGQQVSVAAAVYNAGDAEAAEPFKVALYANDDLLQEQTVAASVYSGDTETVYFDWTPFAQGNYTLKVVADSSEAVSEANESNNTREKAIVVWNPEAALLTAVINGEGNAGGDSLQDIVMSAEVSGPDAVTALEFTGGTVTGEDLAYIKSSLPNLETLTASHTVDINGGVLPDDVFYMHRGLKKVDLPSVKEVGENAFYSCIFMHTLKLTNLRNAESGAFSSLNALKTLVVPNLQELSYALFQMCAGLESVYIPQAYSASENLGFFYENVSLARVWLPEISIIPEYSFTNCGSLSELYLGKEDVAVDNPDITFGGVPEERTVYVPNEHVGSYKNIDDGNPDDEKWYGWTVKPFAESPALGGFVKGLIEHLPEINVLTLGDAPQVESLSDAYNKLTANQQSSVTDEVYGILAEAQEFTTNLATATAVELKNRIAALPSPVTLGYRGEIRHILHTYNILPEKYQQLVTNIEGLTALEEKIPQLEIDAVEELIGTLPLTETILLSDKADVQAARSAYDALSNEQKESITNYGKLTAAEEKIYDLEARAAAQEVDSLIELLPSPQDAGIGDKQAALEANTAYNALNELAKTYVNVTNFNKLADVFAVIAPLERSAMRVEAVNAKIEALPDVDALTLSEKEAVLKARADYELLNDQEKALVSEDSRNKLAAAEQKINELEQSAIPAPCISVSVEKFTLGQGFVLEPVQISINDGENLASVITRILGIGNYKNTGTIDNSFYLSAVKDNGPAEADIPQYIIDAITASEGTVGARAEAGFLGEFDYYRMAGWMYTANNQLPGYGMSDCIPQDGDVFRLQFSVYGYGGDLGYGENSLIEAADKDDLIKKVAEINSSEDKLQMLADTEYKGYYDKALGILLKMQAGQAEVNAVLADLNKTPQPPTDLGKVTVTVQDVVERKWTTLSPWGSNVTIEPLTGLGDYQEPFGVLLEDVEVDITPGMTVREAITGALASQKYYVIGTPAYIEGIGPVTSEDHVRTVGYLSEGDSEERSKWVMSINNWCIWDTSQDYLVEDGDRLTLEYSVDGGIDIHCHPRSGSFLAVKFTTGDKTEDVTSSTGYYMVPEGTDEITVSAERYIGYEGRDIDRYLVIELESGGSSVLNKPAAFSVKDGQVINAIIDNRYNSPNNSSGKTYTYTIEIKRTPVQVGQMIAEIPEIGDIIYGDKEQIDKVRRFYGYLTEDEKEEVNNLETLEAAEARIEAIYEADRLKADEVIDMLIALNKKLKVKELTLEDREAIEQIRAAYEALTPDQKYFFRGWIYGLEKMEEDLAELLDSMNPQEGVAKDYSKDFLLSTMAVNIDAGEKEEMVIFDTPRVGDEDKAYNRDDLIFELSGEEGVFEIEKRVENNGTQDLTKYYVKGLKEGLAYFSISYEGYSGQIPVIPVCVKTPGSQGPALSTDIDCRVTKYDIMYFTEEEKEYMFTFTAESESEAALSAQVNGVTYYPQANGVFTVPLRDKYNPVIVTAYKDGNTTSIAYGIRAKAVSMKITNVSREGSAFYQGDTVSIAYTGIMVPVPKVSRIYNPASMRMEYYSNMPRYHMVGSGSSQYASGALAFELTGSGEVDLTGGYIKLSWFGSGLYAETPTGTAPPNLDADQISNKFSRLPDICLTVVEDPHYEPEDVLSAEAAGTGTVKAGDEVTISIPGIDTEMLKDNHTTMSGTIVDLLDSYTVFGTDIPGFERVKSANVKNTDELDNLKTITFTVPENTKPGKYKLKGGHIWVKYGPTWWTREKEYYVTKMEDVALTVAGEAGSVYKGDINKKIEQGDALEEADYTAESWSVFAEALEAARVAAADDEAVQDGVDEALAALTAAMDALVFDEGASKARIIQTILTAISNSLKGSSGDWDVMDMAAYGMGGYMDIDTLVANALSVYNKTSAPATDYERVAISLTSMGIDATAVDDGEGGTADFIEKIANYNAGAQTPSLGTINNYIFALIAYDSGDYGLPPTANWTREKIMQYLLTAQLGDGGWALNGNKADPDITGMAISALANYRDDENVEAALEDAVNCLSGMQTVSGGFESWGEENSNSASMVIVALSALGIDADTDPRFIKEDISAVDALLSYKTTDNKFGFTDTKYNGMASEQGFRALVAYTKMLDAGKPYNIYIFKDTSIPQPQPVDKTELNAKIAQASALKESDYTSATWSALLTALNKAIEASESETAGQAEIYNALQSLIGAINGLKPADDANEKTITVTFKLIGDSKHYTEDAHEAFQTWIPRTRLTLPEGSYVYDAFVMALDRHNIQYDETQYNYIGGIKAPSGFGGHWLYEFDNGPFSGWMYKVNGKHPSLGLREYRLEDGDDIEWHYTDNYTKEQGSDKWVGAPPASEEPELKEGRLEVEAQVDSGGRAKAKLAGEAVTRLIEETRKASEGKAEVATISLKLPDDTRALELELSREAVKALAGAGDTSVKVSSELATMTFTPEAMAAIAEEAEESEVSISIGQVEQSELPQAAQKLIGGRPVYDFSIEASGKNITAFNGGTVTLALPYALKEGEKAENVTAYYISDSSEIVKMADAKYDAGLGAIVFTTDHFSKFAVGYEFIKFSDVSGWAEEYIYYLANRGMVNGKTETTFAPNDNITRAEFAAIFARMSGANLNAYTKAPFDDVENTGWYFGAVAWAAEKGIINGYDGKFNPNDPITRQEMAVIAVRYADKVEGYTLPALAEALTFADDTEISGYAKASVSIMQRAGIISGKGGNRFAPADNATRAEAAKIITVQMQVMGK